MAAGTTLQRSRRRLLVVPGYIGRITAIASMVWFAVLLTFAAGAWHLWHVHGASLSCPDASAVVGEADGYTSRVERGGWTDPDECIYTSPSGREVDARPAPEVRGPHILDPLWSLLVAGAVILVVWSLALIGSWWTWGTRPRHENRQSLGT